VPTYEYACQSCGRHVEVYQRFTDPPLTVCEVCGGALRKVFHPAGILFKGSGFYSTDSRASASKSKSTSSGSGGDGTAGTSASPSKDGATSTPAATSGSGATSSSSTSTERSA
jgi:putative FmdB family regulatory protein